MIINPIDLTLIGVKQLILIGGGSSIKEGISLGLWNKLEDKFTIGLNYSYKVFPATIQTFLDATFYNNERKALDKLPMLIGQTRNIKNKGSNLLALSCGAIYNRNLQGGAYSCRLCGIYTLSLAVYLLNEGEIFLLGYDNGAITKNLDEKKRCISHWYQGQIEHRGVGKTSYYDVKDRGDKDFGVFKNEKKIKVYNVSPLSHINIFEKIDYATFFSKLNTETYSQDELRLFIKTKLS